MEWLNFIACGYCAAVAFYSLLEGRFFSGGLLTLLSVLNFVIGANII